MYNPAQKIIEKVIFRNQKSHLKIRTVYRRLEWNCLSRCFSVWLHEQSLQYNVILNPNEKNGNELEIPCQGVNTNPVIRYCSSAQLQTWGCKWDNPVLRLLVFCWFPLVWQWYKKMYWSKTLPQGFLGSSPFVTMRVSDVPASLPPVIYRLRCYGNEMQMS